MSKQNPKQIPFDRSKLPCYEVSDVNLVTSFCDMLSLEERDFFCDVVLQKKHAGLGDQWLSLSKDAVLFYRSLIMAMEDAKKTKSFSSVNTPPPSSSIAEKASMARTMSVAQLQQQEVLAKKMKLDKEAREKKQKEEQQ